MLSLLATSISPTPTARGHVEGRFIGVHDGFRGHALPDGGGVQSLALDDTRERLAAVLAHYDNDAILAGLMFGKAAGDSIGLD